MVEMPLWYSVSTPVTSPVIRGVSRPCPSATPYTATRAPMRSSMENRGIKSRAAARNVRWKAPGRFTLDSTQPGPSVLARS
jgi:hypothetical protein